MKILLAASEAVPYCKTGGLADVVGALAPLLQSGDDESLLLIPLYKQVRQNAKNLKKVGSPLAVRLGSSVEPVQLWEANSSAKNRTVFIGSDHFFDRGGLYGEQPGTSYEDNDRRFALYGRAVLEAAKALKFQPTVIHCHDWQTGLIPVYLQTLYRDDSFFKKTAVTYTIHNMAYQGNFNRTSLEMAGLPDLLYNPKFLEFYKQVSFMKGGLVFSDAINTVSPSYAKEIRTDPNFGCGMEGILQDRTKRFRGILNGLDIDEWNPKTDRNLAVRFEKAGLDKRVKNKEDLQNASGLAVQSAAPVLAFIGRLDHQKGVDQLIEIIPVLLRQGAQFVALGQGHAHFLNGLKDLRDQYPTQVRHETAFSEPLAHKIYGGADIFLMPSRYEPCGLGQMIAMRYGSVPIVTPTGGLLDTVEDTLPHKTGTGFVADDMSPGAYLNAVLRAVQLWKDPKKWLAVQRKGMSQDHSWKSSLSEYLSFYRDAVKWRREGPAVVL